MERSEAVVALAKRLGHVAEEDEETLRALCAQAEEELKRRLRRGVTAEDCESAFVLAAAWLALAGLCCGALAEGETGFTAGSLTVRPGGRSPLERSAGLRRQAEQVMGPYLEDWSFCFRGVAG